MSNIAGSPESPNLPASTADVGFSVSLSENGHTLVSQQSPPVVVQKEPPVVILPAKTSRTLRAFSDATDPQGMVAGVCTPKVLRLTSRARNRHSTASPNYICAPYQHSKGEPGP
jgi:hypothetical protein